MVSSMAQNRIKPPISSGDNVKTTTSLFTFPSTYKFTQKFPEEERFSEVNNYFILQSPQKVIWCNESDDGYLFAIAVGQYIEKTQTILFSNDIVHSSYFDLQFENIEFKVQKKNGNILISSNNSILGYSSKSYVLQKLKTSIKPSSSLVGSIWDRGWDSTNGEKYLLKFISEFEVESQLIDGKTEIYTYILIGDKIGILLGSSPLDGAWVGDYKNGVLRLHTSGFRKYLSNPWFDLMEISNFIFQSK